MLSLTVWPKTQVLLNGRRIKLIKVRGGPLKGAGAYGLYIEKKSRYNGISF